MTTTIKLRGDTAADWAAVNPVLSAREPGLETDTDRWKWGDGVTAWNALPYVANPDGTGGGGPAPTPTGPGGVDDPATWSPSLGYDVEAGDDSALAWRNQGTSTLTRMHDRTAVIAGSGANAMHSRVQAIPTAPTWTMTGKVTAPTTDTDYWGVGLAVRDDATARTVLLGPSYNGARRKTLSYFTGDASSGSHPILSTDVTAHLCRYWRIRRNSATSWDFEQSANGVVWSPVSMARDITTHTANPTHVGWAMWHAGALATAGGLEWLRVR